MLICYIVGAVFVFVISLYTLLELNYFLRLCMCVVLAKVSRKRIHILDETSIRGICLTTDIDSLLTHMNNARFVRELDFAKVDFYERTGLYSSIKKHGGNLAVGATTIRYRRFIKLFSSYMITSKVVHWDNQSVYMEHRFVTPADGFVNAVALCRTRLTGCSTYLVLNELLGKGAEDRPSTHPPLLRPDLAFWIRSNEMSSALLRNSQGADGCHIEP